MKNIILGLITLALLITQVSASNSTNNYQYSIDECSAITISDIIQTINEWSNDQAPIGKVITQITCWANSQTNAGGAVMGAGIQPTTTTTTSTNPVGGNDVTTTTYNNDCGSIRINKFNDSDRNGQQGEIENMLADFEFTVIGPMNFSLTTDNEGDAIRFCIPYGVYTITEEDEDGWVNTTAGTQTIEVFTQNLVNVFFGNAEMEIPTTTTTTTTTLPSTTTTTINNTTTTIPVITADEFSSTQSALLALLMAPAFAYMIIRRKSQ